MPLTQQEFLQRFTRRALDSSVSLFLGSGATTDAGYPLWKNLFKPIAEELGLIIDDIHDYYQLAQFYANEEGRDTLSKAVLRQLNQYGHKSKLLDQLMDIGFSNIWTTNFDNAIELNFKDRDVIINKVFKDSDISSASLEDHVNLFKMNGDISNPSEMIIATADNENYSNNHQLMKLFLKRELISSTFLFIGYSFDDRLILDCLSEIRNYLGKAAVTHYAIMKDGRTPFFKYFINDLKTQYGIRVLPVDDYEDIPIVLGKLNQSIRDHRVFISGAFSDRQPELEEFSHNLSKNLSAALLSNDFRIVNGIGRRFGTHLIGYATEYLAKHGIKNPNKHLIITPFVGNSENAASKKKSEREKVIRSCGSAIFVFGDNDYNSVDKKSGVIEEYEIAKRFHKTIIPVAYPGYASEYIWRAVKNNITAHPYLEDTIDNLTYQNPTEIISDTIIHILKTVQQSR